MAQPIAYNPAHQFLVDEGANPNFPGSEIDIELAALERVTDQIRTNLALIQRDDGRPANSIVRWETLHSSLQAYFDDASPPEILISFFDALSDDDADAIRADLDIVFASQDEAEAAAALDKFMSPGRVEQWGDARVADQATAEEGVDDHDFMTSAAVKQQIDARLATEADMDAADDSSKLVGAVTYANIARRRYIDVGAFVNDYNSSQSDLLEAWDGVQTALTAGEGREIVFTQPYSGSRRYRFLTRGKGRLIMPLKARIIWEPGAVCDFSAWGRSGTATPYMYATGTTAGPFAISGAPADKDTSFTLSAGLGVNVAVGDDCIIQSDDDFTTEDGTAGKKSEWVRVSDVSTDTITIMGRLRETYTTNPVLYVVTPVQLQIENPQIIGAGRFTADASADRGIQVIYGKNCRVLGGNIYNSDFTGVVFNNVLNGTIKGVRLEVEPKGVVHDQIQYPISINNACENIIVADCDVVGGKEGIALSSSTGVGNVTRDVTFINNRVRGAWRSGLCSHDVHINWQCIGNTLEDCEQGIDNRIIGGVFKSNKIRRTGAFSSALDCAIQLGSGAGKVTIEGNEIEDVLRGVYMPPSIVHEAAPDNISIFDNVMRGVRAHGVLLENTTSDTSTLGVVTIVGNHITGVTSGSTPRGVELEGKWTNPVVANNIFRGGNGGRAVYLHATDNGAGTNGAISPVVIGNDYENFTEPLVSHSSGEVYAWRNHQIGATAIPTRTINSGGAIGSLVAESYALVSASGTSDDFDSISGGYVGQVLTLAPASTHTITARHIGGGTGNLRLVASANRVLSSVGDSLVVQKRDDGNWYEIGFAALPLAGGTLSGDLTLPNTGLHLFDTDASHDLIIKPGSDLTADRTFTLTTGNANRTFDISAGDVTITAAGAALLDDADAAAQRATLSAAARSQTMTETVLILFPDNRDYPVLRNVANARTITKITTKSSSGTCTVTGKIGTTALGGTANSASSTEQEQAHASANVMAVGDDFKLTVSSNSSCLDLEVSIEYTRTLS